MVSEGGTTEPGARGRVRLHAVLILVFTLGALYMLFSPLVTRMLAMLNEVGLRP